LVAPPGRGPHTHGANKGRERKSSWAHRKTRGLRMLGGTDLSRIEAAVEFASGLADVCPGPRQGGGGGRAVGETVGERRPVVAVSSRVVVGGAWQTVRTLNLRSARFGLGRAPSFEKRMGGGLARPRVQRFANPSRDTRIFAYADGLCLRLYGPPLPDEYRARNSPACVAGFFARGYPGKGPGQSLTAKRRVSVKEWAKGRIFAGTHFCGVFRDTSAVKLR